MASGKTLRKLIPFPKTTDADKLCADQQSMMEALDNINEGHQDFLQAGVVEASDWNFTAAINSFTGVLASEASTGGKAWLPDPVISGALMRSVTTSAALSGLTPSTLPTTGKYMTIGFELAASTWGEKATVSVKSGIEKGTEAEAEAASPAISSGKIRVRDVIVKNTSGVYSIVKQIDRRLWATGGEAKTETVAEGKIGKEAITGPKLGKETMRLLAGAEYTARTEYARSVGYTPSTTRPAFVMLETEEGTGGAGWSLHVGGKEVPFPKGGGWAAFVCLPNQGWEARNMTGKVYASYLIL